MSTQVTFTATDSADVEMAGVKISLQQINVKPIPNPFTLITTEDGTTQSKLPKGNYEVTVTKTGYADKDTTLNVGDDALTILYKLEIESTTEAIHTQAFVESVRAESTQRLLSIPGVVGVGSPGKAITVYVESLNPVEAELPASIKGIPVKAYKTGRISAMSVLEPQSPWLYPDSGIYPKAATDGTRMMKIRPALGGISVGHPEITAGTLGTSLQFLGLDFGISNNHVLANSSTKQVPQASIGDPVLQPGPYDGGTLADSIGTLHKYMPIDRVGLNRIDAAIFQPTDPTILTTDIYDSIPITGVATPQLGNIMNKSGRTTGFTSAAIIDLDATIVVDYDGFSAQYEHQIVTEYQSDGGDSGSAGTIDSKFGGLLFAGSTEVTIFNRPDMLIKELGLPNIGSSVPSQSFNPLPLLIGTGIATWLILRI
jgi:hypothetical protein